ncbi:MAG: hypothetical protein NVS9B1_11850 [Candidatus Dormibacteraceae bacterium]
MVATLRRPRPPANIAGKGALPEAIIASRWPPGLTSAGESGGPWGGEAKIAGRAREVDFPGSPVPGARRFRVEVNEASFMRLNAAGDRLVIESWTEGRGLQVVERE